MACQRAQRPLAAYLVQGADGGGRVRDLIVDEEEQGVLGSQLDALADEKVELADGEVAGH